MKTILAMSLAVTGAAVGAGRQRQRRHIGSTQSCCPNGDERHLNPEEAAVPACWGFNFGTRPEDALVQGATWGVLGSRSSKAGVWGYERDSRDNDDNAWDLNFGTGPSKAAVWCYERASRGNN
jgi:hypothetical protein